MILSHQVVECCPYHILNHPRLAIKTVLLVMNPFLSLAAIIASPHFLNNDVESRCKHHFHWSCILKYSTSSPHAREHCALCKQSLLDAKGESIAWVHNESGVSGGINLGDEIDRHLSYAASFLSLHRPVHRRILKAQGKRRSYT